MATQKIFDFHFHLLFKHILMKDLPLDEDIKVRGVGAVLDELSGGAFDSQSSPNLLSQSQVFVGVTSLLAVEHAFAHKILEVYGVSFRFLLGHLDNDMFDEIKNGKRIHYEEFKRQLDFYLASKPALAAAPYNIEYLQRSAQWKNKSLEDIVKILSGGTKRFLALSIEGGHNLSNVHIRSETERSRNPELQLEEIQNRKDVDIMSLNLCHLSYIPEQHLSGFAQGLNKSAQKIFQSKDFTPTTGLGITQLGKQVIRQALTHQTKPILIDVKHMSVYSRFQFYRYRDKLISENQNVKRLPIISSHTGLTFIGMKEYVTKKLFLTNEYSCGVKKFYQITPENRIIGESNDRRNNDLFANPWSIGLFDEEITEIMMSKGMIGISMDQRVLGAVKTILDGERKKYYEVEYVPDGEWKKLFIDGVFPTAEEGFIQKIFGLTPRPERHAMLLCLHLVHAVRIGNETLGWVENTSPWDHLCIGSDFDGLINPLNHYENVTHLHKLADDLFEYLPVADKYISSGSSKALKYNADGSVNSDYLKKVIADVLFNNGVKFTARYLRNWE